MHGFLPPVPEANLVDGDCLDLLREIPDGSVDLVLGDLPYATTRCTWDKRIPMTPLWDELRRVITDKGAIVMFASQPFTTDLINAARDLYKYSSVWRKSNTTGFLNAHDKPLKAHEDILIFSKGTTCSAKRSKRRMTYNPQGVTMREDAVVKDNRASVRFLGRNTRPVEGKTYTAMANCPTSILEYSKDGNAHPTQKPVALLTYLVNTYSNPGNLVLDPTMGSGSAGVAALGCGRHFVGFERDPEFFDIAERRIAECVRGSL